jgi:CBS domain-containing protein
MLVKQILQRKGSDIWAINPEATIFEALQLMAEKNIGALLVMEQDTLVGIFSERDYARKIVLLDKSSKTTPVGAVMTSRVITIAPAQSVEDCMNLMSTHRFRHLPVVEDGAVLGVISIGDVVNTIIAQQQETIRDLENYITTGSL